MSGNTNPLALTRQWPAWARLVDTLAGGGCIKAPPARGASLVYDGDATDKGIERPCQLNSGA
jgi:hypothetical protein